MIPAARASARLNGRRGSKVGFSCGGAYMNTTLMALATLEMVIHRLSETDYRAAALHASRLKTPGVGGMTSSDPRQPF